MHHPCALITQRFQSVSQIPHRLHELRLVTQISNAETKVMRECWQCDLNIQRRVFLRPSYRRERFALPKGNTCQHGQHHPRITPDGEFAKKGLKFWMRLMIEIVGVIRPVHALQTTSEHIRFLLRQSALKAAEEVWTKRNAVEFGQMNELKFRVPGEPFINRHKDACERLPLPLMIPCAQAGVVHIHFIRHTKTVKPFPRPTVGHQDFRPWRILFPPTHHGLYGRLRLVGQNDR